MSLHSLSSVKKYWNSTRSQALKVRAQDVSPAFKVDLSNIMSKIEKDSPNWFTGKGMDVSVYDSKVDFQDPITRYTDIQGFKRNLEFLSQALDPSYELLGIRQISDNEFEARWTMSFTVVPVANSPLGKFWQPKLDVTGERQSNRLQDVMRAAGTTLYGVDSETKLINRHIDTWDSVSNQEFFSTEAFLDVLTQIFNFQRTPDIPTPKFTILKKFSKYSIRQYSPFVVAEETFLSSSPDARVSAFRSLAKYISGGNASGSKQQMTTPVITTPEKMQFMLPVSTLADAPTPQEGSEIKIREVPASTCAVLTFSGKVDADVQQQKLGELLQVIRSDGFEPVKTAEGKVFNYLAQYNDPGVNPLFRRNEIIVPITGFNLW